jgi:hypothetical protein
MGKSDLVLDEDGTIHRRGWSIEYRYTERVYAGLFKTYKSKQGMEGYECLLCHEKLLEDDLIFVHGEDIEMVYHLLCVETVIMLVDPTWTDLPFEQYRLILEEKYKR